MPAGPIIPVQILKQTAALTTRAWYQCCMLRENFSMLVSNIESGGQVQIYVSNLQSPPTTAFAAGDGTAPYGQPLTSDTAVEISAMYQNICAVKIAAGSTPVQTAALLYGWAQQ
jgi:hypothetical protein